MTDIFTKNKRSEIMRAVTPKGNKTTEIKLICLFKQNAITGWQRHYPIFGKPDFVFKNKKIAIFIDGCFWHGHNCRNTKPKDNAEYWRKKIIKNKERDWTVTKTLAEKKWKVVRLWECELKKNALPRKLQFLKTPNGLSGKLSRLTIPKTAFSHS